MIAEEWFLDNVFRSSDLRTTALYTMDDDRASEIIGDCYYSIMDVSISERCEIQVKPIPAGEGDPRFTHKQFGVLGWTIVLPPRRAHDGAAAERRKVRAAGRE